MCAQNEPHAHVHARIAEHVSKDLGVDVDATEVADMLEHRDIARAGDNRMKYDAVIAEAREYGIVP